MLDSGDYAFSFSGLKTAVRVFLQRGFSPEDLPHICASFQQAVVEVLVAKAFRAVREKSCGILAISGGVSSNSALRRLAEARAAEAGVALRLPPPELRTDNALMIAFVAAHRWATKPDANDLEADILPQFNEAFAQR
jgi:N6-L-threonylcarbamoyladenine synthase